MTNLLIHWMDGPMKGAYTNRLPIQLSRRWLLHVASKGYRLELVYDLRRDAYEVKVWEVTE